MITIQQKNKANKPNCENSMHTFFPKQNLKSQLVDSDD